MIRTPEASFIQTVWDYYAAHKRRMPWRDNPTPYFVLVSELMLQQTQVSRVLPKFTTFVAYFPTVEALAAAPLSNVLAAWSGLGYNRRAKFLWQAAAVISNKYDGKVPATLEELTVLPGVGPNTAGAILAYAFNQPTVFIETNIRTVYIYHFFADHSAPVTDVELQYLVERTLPVENPREWYWALMDYGTYLKATAGAQLHKAHGHRAQSRFEGSRRQIRGKVLRLLASGPHHIDELAALIVDDRLAGVVDDLMSEGFLIQTPRGWQLRR